MKSLGNDFYIPFHEIDSIIEKSGYKKRNTIGVVDSENKFFEKNFCWLLEEIGLVSPDAKSIDGLSDTITLLAQCRHRQSPATIFQSRMTQSEYRKIIVFLGKNITEKLNDISREVDHEKKKIEEIELIKSSFDQEAQHSVDVEYLQKEKEKISIIHEMLSQFTKIKKQLNKINLIIDKDEKLIDELISLNADDSELHQVQKDLDNLVEKAKLCTSSPLFLLEGMDIQALNALIAYGSPVNPARLLIDKIPDLIREKINHSLYTVFDEGKNSLSQSLGARFIDDDGKGEKLIWPDEDIFKKISDARMRLSEESEEKISDVNQKRCMAFVNGIQKKYTTKLNEMHERITQIKVLSKPIADMYWKGTELCNAGRKEEGKAFRGLALDLVKISNEYIIDLSQNKETFAGKISTLLAYDKKVKDIKNHRIWPIVVGNLLVACTVIGLVIQVGLYAHSGTILFLKTDRERKIDVVKAHVKDIIKSTPKAN